LDKDDEIENEGILLETAECQKEGACCSTPTVFRRRAFLWTPRDGILLDGVFVDSQAF
jgi:hypothetical protein